MPKERAWELQLDMKLLDLARGVAIEGGYALPGKMLLTAASDGLTVEIDVEIVEQRARARRVAIATDAPGGVTSTTMREVPIRDLMATAVRRSLARVEIQGKEAKITPLRDREIDEAALTAIKRVVGYVEVSK